MLSAWHHTLTVTEDQFKTATIRALNKTARWFRMRVAGETASRLGVKVGTVKAGLVVVRARPNQLTVTVALKPSGAVIKAASLGSPQPTQRGVRTGRKHWDHAFVAKKPSGHQAIFRRRGKFRLPIQELKIVVTGAMSDVMEALSEGPAMQQFEKLFQHELRYLMHGR